MSEWRVEQTNAEFGVMTSAAPRRKRTIVRAEGSAELYYELLTEGGHACTLPDPKLFESGAEIACTQPLLRQGRREPCGKRYWRCTRFWSRRPYWSDDWGW